MKRGKRLSVSLEEQKSVFLKYEEHFKGPELPRSCSVVYKEISKLLCARMTPNALYFSVKTNCLYFFGKIENNTPDDDASGSTSSCDSISGDCTDSDKNTDSTCSSQ